MVPNLTRTSRWVTIYMYGNWVLGQWRLPPMWVCQSLWKKITPSVLQGGLYSLFLCLLPLVFADTALIGIFNRKFFTIIVFGGSHDPLLPPVNLPRLECWREEDCAHCWFPGRWLTSLWFIWQYFCTIPLVPVLISYFESSNIFYSNIIITITFVCLQQ